MPLNRRAAVEKQGARFALFASPALSNESPLPSSAAKPLAQRGQRTRQLVLAGAMAARERTDSSEPIVEPAKRAGSASMRSR